MTTLTATQTFTRTHAKYLASKVVSDLYQCSRLYGRPSSESIADYESELVERLVHGYLDRYEFGFKKTGKRVVSWRYEVNSHGDLIGGGTDDRAGGVYARAVVEGASYYNTTTSSTKWWDLTDAERLAFEDTLPFARVNGSLPSDGNGYWVADRIYRNGGTAVSRTTFTPS